MSRALYSSRQAVVYPDAPELLPELRPVIEGVKRTKLDLDRCAGQCRWIAHGDCAIECTTCHDRVAEIVLAIQSYE